MGLIDRQYLETPFYGVLRMTAWLARTGDVINSKRVRHLMRLMGAGGDLSPAAGNGPQSSGS